MKLAYDFNDPISLLKCYIYLSFSYAQLKKYKKGRNVLM
jgi:hypothetical protein